jgi:AbrB family looped-hinge helix DNA binding protein
MMQKTYSVDEIFQDIDGDPDNVLMTIPEEIAAELGWRPGDTLNITVEENHCISIKKN